MTTCQLPLRKWSMSTNAITLARKYYEERGKFFDWDLSRFQELHYAFVTPQYVLLAAEVPSTTTTVGCWHVEFAIGETCLRNFIRHMPYYLPYISWARPGRKRSEVKFYSTDKLIRLIGT